MNWSRTDYQVASTFEVEPFVYPPRSAKLTMLTNYPEELDSPLLVSEEKFGESGHLRTFITPESCQLLDTVREIIQLILISERPAALISTKASTLLFQTTPVQMSTIKNNLKPELPSTKQLIHSSLLTASRILLAAIQSRTPLSKSCTNEDIMAINMSLWLVPLSIWKKIPGIFLFVLLVINPYVRDRPEGRFVKGMISAGGVGVEVAGYDSGITEGEGVASCILRAMLKIQGWLASDGEVEV